MTDTLDKPQVNGKTVQEYIDERPTWPDGTMLPTAPMTAMQFRIWALALPPPAKMIRALAPANVKSARNSNGN